MHLRSTIFVYHVKEDVKFDLMCNAVEIMEYLFYLNINQLDALNFMMSLFHASTCFEHTCASSGGQNCINNLWYHHIYRWPSRAQVERGLS